MRIALGLGLAAAGLLLAAAAPQAGRALAGKDGEDWPSTGRTWADQRFSPLTQINVETVGKLGLAWHHEFDTDRGQEATPVEVDGVLYTTTAWSKVYAFDARTGRLLWSYDPEVDRARGFLACCDVVNRGVAVSGGKVYAAALDGRLTALDAGTGKVVWSAVTVDQGKSYTITGAPRVIHGKVLIGNGGSEYGVRGYVSAYDAETGKLAWRFYTTPSPSGKPDGAASDAALEKAARSTWGGAGVPEAGGGGTVWESITYDPGLNLVYFGTGNGSPWNARHRSDGKSDNLFLSSIVAVDPDTGKYAWHYQPTPDDTWDFDATQHLMLADLTIDGRPRKVVMQANKNGFFYVIDRATGALISAKGFVPMTWATGVDPKTGRPVEVPGARYETKVAVISPSPTGAHNWQPMAFDPRQGLVFIPAMESGLVFGDDPKFKYREGAVNFAFDPLLLALPDEKAQRAAIKASLKGELLAWDPVKQEARWSTPHEYYWNGGILATAGDLVFQGDAEGRFAAYDSRTGKQVWRYDAGMGVVAGASTYALDGQQYVALMVGYGGTGPLFQHWALPDRPRLPGRLLVFKLGGTDTLPAISRPPPRTIDLTGVHSAGDVDQGSLLFHQNCAICHSSNASGRYLPDLQTSSMITSDAAFRTVVLDGALASNGMVGFARFLTPAQAEAIRAYIIQESRRNQAMLAAQ
ncbi:MAG: PQQ-dependent dehydrogenase, methanol/ethanol family [Caulobacteraceae bacterium]|nr:PQQ-dependent dehydrogenase, methanol/ethanol family [Caulobacteraceae bacterium]